MPVFGEIVAFIALVAIAGIAGLGFGIFIVAPRLSRFADHSDEESGARDD